MTILKYSEGQIEKVYKIKSEEEEDELNKKMSDAKEKKLNKEANKKSPFWTK